MLNYNNLAIRFGNHLRFMPVKLKDRNLLSLPIKKELLKMFDIFKYLWYKYFSIGQDIPLWETFFRGCLSGVVLFWLLNIFKLLF